MRRTIAIASALAMGGATGCAGGLPLLHPARTLDKGEVRAAAGVSGNATAGGIADDLKNARNDAATNPNALNGNPDALYAKGALVAAAIGPGIAPFVAGRVGIGNSFEGGVAYTGRDARVDVRRSFDTGPWSLSIGIGGSAALYGRQQGAEIPGVDLGSLHGWGADVPLLVGWQSDGGLYAIWLGARGGYEHDTIEQVTSEPKSITIGTPPIGLTANRTWAGGLVGVATGFRHVHVALEIDAAYQNVSGSFGGTEVKVSGVTIAPASALWWDF